MPDTADRTVLQRMAAPKGVATGLSEMSPAKALRQALARAGDAALRAAIGIRELAQDTLVPDDLAADLPDPALILLLEGPEGARGAAIACGQVVGAVIEAQTLGKVLTSPAADRRPTRTDAALVAGFLDPALVQFGTLILGCAVPPPVDGFSCGTVLSDARALQMVLADAAHLRFRAELDFGLGAKTGTLQLVFPAERVACPTAQQSATDWRATLENAVLGTSARLEAVLCRLRLPLAEIAALQVGEVLPLDGATLDDVALVGPEGGRVVTARLGRSGPVRAVRLAVGGGAFAAAAPVMEPAEISLAAAPGGAAPMPPGAPGPDGAGMAMPDPAAPPPAPMPAAAMEGDLPALGAMDPAPPAAPMDPAPMQAAAMEPAPMQPAPMDLAGMDLPTIEPPAETP